MTNPALSQKALDRTAIFYRARFSCARLRNLQSDCAQVLSGQFQIRERRLFRPMAQQVADNLPRH
jgi:hypothetical protein